MREKVKVPASNVLGFVQHNITPTSDEGTESRIEASIVQHHKKEVTPSNSNKGKSSLQAEPESTEELSSQKAEQKASPKWKEWLKKKRDSLAFWFPWQS